MLVLVSLDLDLSLLLVCFGVYLWEVCLLLGDLPRPLLAGCRVQLGDGALGGPFLRPLLLGDLVRCLLGLVCDLDLFLLAGVLGPRTSVLTLLEIDLVVDLESDLECDELVSSVGGGVGGTRPGSELVSLLGEGSVLGDLGLMSSSGISSLIGSGDPSFSGVGDRSWVCFAGASSRSEQGEFSSTCLSGDFSRSELGDLSLTCLSGDFSRSKLDNLFLTCLSGDFSRSKLDNLSLTCLSGDFSRSELGDLSLTCLSGDFSSSCCSSSEPGVEGSGIPAAGVEGGSACRSFMACLIIFSVTEDCLTILAFMRSSIFFLCVLISFLVVIISRLKRLMNIALSFNLGPLLAPWQGLC